MMKKKITAEQEKEVVRLLVENDWTRRHIDKFIIDEYNVSFTPGGISGMLERNGVRLIDVKRATYTRSDKTRKKITFDQERELHEWMKSNQPLYNSELKKHVEDMYSIDLSKQGLINLLRRNGFVMVGKKRIWQQQGN